MPKPDKVYLDTNLMYNWFKLRFTKKRKQADEEEIIKFLAQHKEIECFISAFTVAEIVARLKNEFKDLITLNDIRYSIEIFQDSINCQIIKLDKFRDMKDKDREGILISPQIVEFAFECLDSKDAIHIDIAKSNDLWFITRDNDVTRVKNIYNNVMGEKKFRKQFD